MPQSPPSSSSSSPSPHSFDAVASNGAISAQKNALRREMKERLRRLDVDRNAVASDIFVNLGRDLSFSLANTIGVYLDFGSEAPTQSFVPKLFISPLTGQNGESLCIRRRIAVPFCDGPNLRFYQLDLPLDDKTTSAPVFFDLEPATFGILEPKLARRRDQSRLIAPQELEVVLVPGLAFDASGGRLGRGAGFYDRFLRTLPASTRIIGIAFDEQIVDQTPVDAFDCPMHAIVTPTRYLECNRSKID